MESIEVINRRLKDHYGKFEDGRSNWRVVWSDDQFEKRWITCTPEGLDLVTPVIEEVPKYMYARHRYILERLVPVPSFITNELVEKTSYEPVWTFQDSQGNALPPIWEAIYLLIKMVRENMEGAGHKAPYRLPEEMGNTREAIATRVDKLQRELFGDESKLGDALALDSAVGYGERKRSDWTN